MLRPSIVSGAVACGLLMVGAAPSWALCQNGGTAQTVSAGQNLAQIIEASAPPCTLTVNAGTYSAQATTHTSDGIFRISSGITIRSASGAGSTTLQVAAGKDYTVIVQDFAPTGGCPSGATLEGFTILGGRQGLLVRPLQGVSGCSSLSNITLKSLVVTPDSSSGSGHGIELYKTNNSAIDSCVVTTARNNGIFVYGGSNNNLIINNTIQQTLIQHAIAIQDSDGNQVIGNTITGSAFSGIVLNGSALTGPGSSYARIERNTISGHKYDGIALSDRSRFAYVGQNAIQSSSYDPQTKPTPNPAQGTGIWLNNGSNGAYVYGNRTAGSPESGFAVFQTSSSLLQANKVSANFQSGILIVDDANFSAPGSARPASTHVHHNYVHYNALNAQVNVRGAANTDVAFNFLSGRSGFGAALASTATGGVALDRASTAAVYENTITSVDTRVYVFASVAGARFFRNRHLDVSGNPAAAPGLRGLTYSLSPAGVEWDASVTLGGSHWSEFAASGDPGVLPYKRFIYDAVHGIDLNGPYTDKFPFKSEHLGRPYSVAVREPFTGQVLAAGTRKTIQWRSEGCVLVDLYYKPSASPAVLIAQNYPSTGFYMWDLPSGLSAGSYTIQIDCKDSTGGFPGASGASGTFSVGTNALALLTPGRSFRATNGGTLRVSWRGSGISGTVNVYVQKVGGAATLVASGVTGTSTTVTLPASVNSSNDVIVRVQSSGNPNQQDAVDGTIMVRGAGGSFQPSLAGSVFTIGSTQFLRWVGPSTSMTVDLDLVEGTTAVHGIARDLPDFGNFTWFVPEMWSAASKVRATFKDANGVVLGTADSGTFDVRYAGSSGSLVPRYRLYSPVTLEHLFTTDLNEYNVLGGFAGVWEKEGVSSQVYSGPATAGGIDAVPYYRLYDKTKRWHHWTTDRNEYLTLRQFSSIYDAEGVDGYVLPSAVGGTVPLYRLLYVPIAGLHHWTTDTNEKNVLLTRGWVVDQLTFDYVFP
jgi:parallel beta-helix repeat protein